MGLGVFPKVPAEVIELGEGWGTIELGMHPTGYDNNLDKTWRITVRPGYRVGIKFTVFDVEDSYEEGNGSCVYDYLQVSCAGVCLYAHVRSHIVLTLDMHGAVFVFRRCS